MVLTEFDANKLAVINPHDLLEPVEGMPKVAVACYAKETFEKMLSGFDSAKIAESSTANGKMLVYKVVYKGVDIALFMLPVGAPACAAMMEDVYRMGADIIIIFGTCGVLDKSIEDCGIIIPNSAIRDEGTSYHYAPASDEIKVNEKYLSMFTEMLDEFGVKYTVGKTWTTDAIYRETIDKIKRRKEQGCICVDMECSADAAVAQFRGKDLVQFFYAADNLDAEEWDKRSLSNSAKLDEKDRIAKIALELAVRIMVKSKVKVMDNYVDEKDYKLLESDKYTFFVLRKIIDGPCKLLLSDHERLIICFSTPPFPVWIWTPDDATEDEMERAYQIIVEYDLMNKEHSFNIKYELSDYFIRRAKKDGINLSATTNLFAYNCPNPIMPDKKADGEIYKCEMKDKEELADFIEMFHEETGIDHMDRNGCLEYAESNIQDERTFFWKDTEGNHVATCHYKINGELANIGLVFTRPEYRRKYYAENLVYYVTKMAEEEGYVPMLYTDADYVASNACYEKIGYSLRGKLCTVS